MIIDGNGEDSLRPFLADDVLIQKFCDGPGFRHSLAELVRTRLLTLLFDNASTKLDAFIADIGRGTGNQLFYLILVFTAE